MKNSSIVIGPIKKNEPTVNRFSILTDRISKMKNGNFFEVTGLSTKSEVASFRAAVQYVAKKNSTKVTTHFSNGILKVEKQKSLKLV